MLSRLITIMVAVSFVIIPAYAEEGTAATETEAPAVAKSEKVTLFDQLREAYEKNDREAMGKILDQMQERRMKMRQRQAEFRQSRQGQRMNARRGGWAQGRFGRGQGFRQMGPWQGANFRRGGWNRGPGQFGCGMCGGCGWGCQRGFGYGPGMKWHHGGARFDQAGYGWGGPRCGHAGRRFGYGPRWQRHRWSDTDSERSARYKQRSEWDW